MKSFLGILTVAFIVLKLTHYIDWSWWLILLPLYGGVAFLIPLAVVWVILYKAPNSRLANWIVNIFGGK